MGTYGSNIDRYVYCHTYDRPQKIRKCMETPGILIGLLIDI